MLIRRVFQTIIEQSNRFNWSVSDSKEAHREQCSNPPDDAECFLCNAFFRNLSIRTAIIFWLSSSRGVCLKTNPHPSMAIRLVP